jgi:hypothetical protein
VRRRLRAWARWRRAASVTFHSLGLAACAAFTLIAALDNNRGSAIGWGVCTLCWLIGFLSAIERDPLWKWLQRRQARQLHEMGDITMRVLHRQGEQRPELIDQIEWHTDSIQALQVELKAVADGRRRVSSAELRAMDHRLMVDVAPVVEQFAADRPTRYNRFMARRMSRSARRVGESS